MSMILPGQSTCPACAHVQDLDIVSSVNADRRPDLRAQILDRSFQRFVCAACAVSFQVEPELTYLDIGRKQWILVRPLEDEVDWADLEAIATSLHASLFGLTAPLPAQRVGKGLRARIVFGWTALVEKLLCDDHELDDVSIELFKIALIQSAPSLRMTDDTQLRLLAVQEAELLFMWVADERADAPEEMWVPRATYEDIMADQVGWQVLREQLTAGPFVDMNRLLLPAGADDAAG